MGAEAAATVSVPMVTGGRPSRIQSHSRSGRRRDDGAGEVGAGGEGLAQLPHEGQLDGVVLVQGAQSESGRLPAHAALGERVALRLFGQLYTLDELGLSTELLARLTALLSQRSGLVIIAGPSGGGKTTTVYAALRFLAQHRDGAHLSIEDPVEQRLRLAGIPVDQVELCPERGLTAEEALVGALRQDVDVLALGEVRRPEEAALALEAAHTGRLVIVGLHAGSAAEASQRMRDLGADPAVLSETLRGVLHQHLQTTPCPDGDAAACSRCGGSGRIRIPIATLWTQEET